MDEAFPPRHKGEKARMYRYQDRVLTVVETWSQHMFGDDGETGERVPMAREIRAGDWRKPWSACRLIDRSNAKSTFPHPPARYLSGAGWRAG